MAAMRRDEREYLLHTFALEDKLEGTWLPRGGMKENIYCILLLWKINWREHGCHEEGRTRISTAYLCFGR